MAFNELLKLVIAALELIVKIKKPRSPRSVPAGRVYKAATSQPRVKAPLSKNRAASLQPQKPGFFSRLFHLLLAIVEIFVLWQILLRLLRRYFKFPAPAIIGRFLDSRARRRMQPPIQVVERSGAKEGMVILEIGCGSGAFTPYFARTAGERGRVFALDIQPQMLRQIRRKLQHPENQDVPHIQLIAGSAFELPFNSESLDLVYMVTVFQEIPEKLRLLKEIRRTLKPAGILAITEFLPDPDYPWATTTVKMIKQGGFCVDDLEGNLWNYTARFKKA